MKLFKNIKIKWLQHRVYKYTLKYEDFLSKSKIFLEKTQKYDAALQSSNRTFGSSSSYSLKLIESIAKARHKSNHYSILANIYLDKKLDLEEELSSLKYPKA